MNDVSKEDTVVKSNYMIMNGSYDLSLEEQKLILVLASKVSPEHQNFHEYELKIADIMELFGVATKTKYKEIPKITKGLMSKPFEIYDFENEEMVQLNWLSSAKYKKGSGTVRLCFDPNLGKYMLELKERFTTYQLGNVIRMKCKYSPRLYEILKCNEFKKQGCEEIEIDELRRLLKIEDIYPRYIDFKRKVIEQAIKEINQLTDLEINYKEIKTSRKVTSLIFYIRPQAAQKQKAIQPDPPQQYQAAAEPTKDNAISYLRMINDIFTIYGLVPISENEKTKAIINEISTREQECPGTIITLADNLANMQKNTTINNATSYFIGKFESEKLDSFLLSEKPNQSTKSEYKIYVPPDTLEELMKENQD